MYWSKRSKNDIISSVIIFTVLLDLQRSIYLVGVPVRVKWAMEFFFDDENILISHKYQLYPASAPCTSKISKDIQNAQSQEKIKKREN